MQFEALVSSAELESAPVAEPTPEPTPERAAARTSGSRGQIPADTQRAGLDSQFGRDRVLPIAEVSRRLRFGHGSG